MAMRHATEKMASAEIEQASSRPSRKRLFCRTRSGQILAQRPCPMHEACQGFFVDDLPLFPSFAT
jgi:hypothetical protein